MNRYKVPLSILVMLMGLWLWFGLTSQTAQAQETSLPEVPSELGTLPEVAGYQSPCKPGVRANFSTWHSNGSTSRRAYDWRCHKDPNTPPADRYVIHAPHAGIVHTVSWSHPEYGVIFIDNTEYDACTIIAHLDPSKFVVQDGDYVEAGEPIGAYFTVIKTGNRFPYTLPPHAHMVAQDGSCASSNYSSVRSKERPIKYNETGNIPKPKISLDGSQAGSDGPMVWVTAGSCASGSEPCNTPNDEVPTGHFPDVPVTHTFFPYIETLHHLGIVSGDDGAYMPDDFLSRGAAAKLIILGIDDYQEYNDGQCAFDDVCPSHTFYHYIRRLKELGITSPDATHYNPDLALTRGGLAKFVVIAHDGTEPSYNDCVVIFNDVPCTDTFYAHTRRLQAIFDANGFSLGDDGNYYPNDDVTRGAAAKLVIVGLDLHEHLPRFYDVAHDNTFYPYINAIAERGITHGCDSSSAYPRFCPEENLTRGQAAAFIVRAFGLSPNVSGQSFPDVPPSHAFYPYIEYLYQHGIVSGDNGSFYPDEPVTRGQMAKMIVNALNHLGITCSYDTPLTFPDVPTDHTFYSFIQCLIEQQIAHGYSDHTFRPDNNITRAESAKLIYLAFVEHVEQGSQEPSDSENDQRAGATNLGTPGKNAYAAFIVPHDDTDWFTFSVPATGTLAAGSTSLLVYVSHGINFSPALHIEDSGGNAVPFDPIILEGDSISDGYIAVQLSTLSAGDYYLRLTNDRPFAVEGIEGYINIIANPAAPTAIHLASFSTPQRPAKFPWEAALLLLGMGSLLYLGRRYRQEATAS